MNCWLIFIFIFNSILFLLCCLSRLGRREEEGGSKTGGKKSPNTPPIRLHFTPGDTEHQPPSQPARQTHTQTYTDRQTGCCTLLEIFMNICWWGGAKAIYHCHSTDKVYDIHSTPSTNIHRNSIVTVFLTEDISSRENTASDIDATELKPSWRKIRPLS